MFLTLTPTLLKLSIGFLKIMKQGNNNIKMRSILFGMQALNKFIR